MATIDSYLVLCNEVYFIKIHKYFNILNKIQRITLVKEIDEKFQAFAITIVFFF